MAWEVILVDEVDDWYLQIAKEDRDSAELISAAIDKLEDEGPTLTAPLVKRIRSSKIHNLKELRPGPSGKTEIRILFAFDHERQAILLVGGDKSGQ